MFNTKGKDRSIFGRILVQPSRRNVFLQGYFSTVLVMVSLMLFAGCQNSQPTQIANEVSNILITPEINSISTADGQTTENTLHEITIEPKLRKPTPLINTEGPEPKFEICSPLEEHNLRYLSGIVSSPYHPPPMGKDDRHQGVDFAYYNQGTRGSIEGEGVQAILPGWVAVVIENRLPYGNMIIIETLPSHLPK
jgi:hypothetical protein